MTSQPYDYDTSWEQRWDDMKKYGPYSRHVRRWMHYLISPLAFRSVLDVGCGQGETLSELVATYPDLNAVGGIDYSQSGVDMTRARVGRGDYHTLDLQTTDMFDLFGRKYDLTVCLDVVEHIEDDVASLRNLRRITGHYAVVGSVQGTHLPEWEKEVVGHVRNYRRGELVEKMESVGFVIDRVVE